MFIGRIEGQNFGLNVNAINRSVSRNTDFVKVSNQQENLRDTLLLSPRGKRQSIIEQLMKQKDLIQENKQAAIDWSVENGTGNIQQLDEYDQQLKNIDEQIAQIQTEQVEEDTKTKEAGESSIYEKPKTEEEFQMKNMEAITSLSFATDQAEIISSVQNQMKGRVRVLESEIKTGNGNIEKKLEEVSELEKNVQNLTSEITGKLKNVNDQISQMNDDQITIPTVEDIKSSNVEQGISVESADSMEEKESSINSVLSEERVQAITDD